eukprot:9226195-Pyramimonas_sp.AAC.1
MRRLRVSGRRRRRNFSEPMPPPFAMPFPPHLVRLVVFAMSGGSARETLVLNSDLLRMIGESAR